MAEKSNISYRPEIDGLRAIAVILVVLFHAKLEPFTAGFIGVDIFFVISGYLITSIILADLQKGKFELLKFYERRARRILPALLFVIIITTPASMALMLPSQLEDFMQSIVAVMFFASNILFWIESDYFSTASELKPLLHTWSLAVEEQYYLLFPVFAIIIWRFMPSFLGVCVFILTLLSLVLSSWWIAYDSSANFYLLPFRAWEIMTGALLVIYREYFKTRYQDLIAMLGLAGIAASLILFDAKTPFPSIYTLLPVISTSLVLIYAQTDTYVAKLLGWEPLVKVGLISYSVYLWHQPIFSNLRLYFYNGTPHYYHPILILAPFIFGYFSWKYVELPFRQHNTVNLKFFSLGIFGMFIFLNVLFLAKVNDFISSKKFDENFINSQIYANHWVGWEDCDVSLPYVDLGGCKILNPRVKAELAIIGDSHAGHYAKGFLDLASFKDENYILFRRAGCFPVLEESIGFLSCQNNYIAEAIKWAGNNPDIHTVVLSGYANLKIFGSRLVDLKLVQNFQITNITFVKFCLWQNELFTIIVQNTQCWRLCIQFRRLCYHYHRFSTSFQILNGTS